MRIFFSTLFDGETYPASILNNSVSLGHLHLGPTGLLHFFELHLGLGYYNNDSNIRVMQYCEQLRSRKRGSFYEKSFEQNEIDVAKTLLQWRDELVMANWNFQVDDSASDRLKTIAKVEEGLRIDAGVADRYKILLDTLNGCNCLPVSEVVLHEPLGVMPPMFNRLFTILQTKKIRVHEREISYEVGATDLDRLKSFVLGSGNSTTHKKIEARKDDSIRILRFPNMLSASKALSSFMEVNPTFRPVVINESSNPCLSLALKHDGLASTGQSHVCCIDPDVQLLSLLPVWLWKPYDARQVLDFLLAPINILPFTLRKIWSKSFCNQPGVKSEEWQEDVKKYLDKTSEKDRNKYQARIEYLFSVAKEQNSPISKEDLISYFGYFHQIFNGRRAFAKDDVSKGRLGKLCNALKDFIGLVERASKSQFSKLELEKLIRMVLRPYEVVVHKKEVEGVHEVAHPGLVVDTCQDLLWFGFFGESGSSSLQSNWTQEEIAWLEKKDVLIDIASNMSKRNYWFLTQWLCHVDNRLFLVLPTVVEGEAVQPHPFFALLKACFENLHTLIIDIERPEQMALHGFQPLKLDKTGVCKVPSSPGYWIVEKVHLLGHTRVESHNSLQKLISYPYQWVLEYGARMKRGDHFCLPAFHTFYGTISHAIFQKLLLMPDVFSLTVEALQDRYEQTANEVIEQCGLLLNIRGEERRLKQFKQGLCNSFRKLVDHIKENGWEVEGCEIEEKSCIGGEEVGGRCDVLLRRSGNPNERAIIDLKFANMKKYRDLMYDEEDLQLAIYSKIFNKEESFCPTAYFIIENELLFCTDRSAFKKAIIIPPGGRFPANYEDQLQQLQKVVARRREELSKGEIEVGEAVEVAQLSIYQKGCTELLPSPEKGIKPKSKYNNYSTFIDTV